MLIDVLVPGRKDPLKLTVHVICGSYDLPARALVQNFNQYNGAYGCGFCEQPGRSFQTQKGGTVRVFPYNLNSPNGPLRTNDSTTEHARQAISEHKVVRISIGFSLMRFVYDSVLDLRCERSILVVLSKIFKLH